LFAIAIPFKGQSEVARGADADESVTSLRCGAEMHGVEQDVRGLTYRALRARSGKAARFQHRPLDEMPEDAVAIDQVWADVWEEEQLRRALEQVRESAGQTKAFRAFELYVMRDQPAEAVAASLGMHIKSVYRAREQITRLLHEQVAAMNDED
jgi:hypothetical protein